MTRQASGAAAEHVRRLGPDVVLLVETDGWWDERLAPMKAS
jgi:hypothetical protein